MRDAAYELKVPPACTTGCWARLEEIDQPTWLPSGSTRSSRATRSRSIARKLRVKRTDLAEANYLHTNARLTPGQQLVVPHEPTVLMALNADRPAPSERQEEPAAAAAAAPALEPSAEDRVRISYRVKKGDTLGSIARTFRRLSPSFRAGTASAAAAS